ncbi:MAG: Uma2 family endonuclease [Thermoanaerobaculia bacterium]
MATTSTKLTYEDFLLFPDDGRRHEIIDGEHYVNPSPNTKHQIVSARLFYGLYHHVEHHRLGIVFAAPYDVVLSNFDVVEPDLLFISNARRHIITDANVQGAPDLLVEILSPSNRKYDEVVKFKRYDALGVGEYWIVDPEEENVRVYRRDAGGLARVEIDDTITTPLLPDFVLRLRDLFVFVL